MAAFLPAALLVSVPLAAQQAPVPDAIPVALLYDLSSRQTLFAREPTHRFMPASVTKVMTAYTAFDLIAEGKLSPATRVTISRELQEEWGRVGSTMFLEAGQRPTVGQLILGITTVSGNDATVALAVAAAGSVAGWTELMNANAAELGMADSHFYSPNGFPDEGRTFTTARDLAILAEAITTRHAELYERYFGHGRLTWNAITQYNHDPITGRIEGADGMKTGFTNEAGYTFLGSAERGGRRLVMVLAGSPSSAMRNAAARDLMRWGFTAFRSRQILPEGTIVGEARVQNGIGDSVGLRTASDVTASIPTGGEASPRLSIRYRGPVEAPIDRGEVIAWLRVELDGHPPVEVPLQAAKPIAEANFWHRLINGVYGLFA